MEIDVLQRLLKSKLDFYLTTVGFLILAGGMYIYLNYYLQNKGDQVIIVMLTFSSVLGYAFVLIGLMFSANDFGRENRLKELIYQIKKIELTMELKKLREKYKVYEQISLKEKMTIFLLKMKLWFRTLKR